MPATYEPIATTTLSSAASTITFNSIPNTFTDLRLSIVSQNDTSSYQIFMRFNNDSGGNYNYTAMQGNGTAASSSRGGVGSTEIQIGAQGISSSSTWAFHAVDIFSYAGSTNKTILNTTASDRNGAGTIRSIVGLWLNTSAITRIDLLANTGNFTSGTTATLYGIKAA